ncbi:hypothetical protein DKE52_008070 [Acinetobacter pittii]|uniref:Uncharacterized protein n=1 Tax=Acinetobacter pittii TaxID=48296 RepID=A0A3G6YJ68_ACIPI|nr:hypothetical protein DKE52_008070 [Acinetobacter pittii]
MDQKIILKSLSSSFEKKTRLHLNLKPHGRSRVFGFFNGVAKFQGNNVYKSDHLKGRMASDLSIEESSEAVIVFQIMNIDTKNSEVDIIGSVNYGLEVFNFEGLLEKDI